MMCTLRLNKQNYLLEMKTKAEESIFHNKIVTEDFVPIEKSPTDILDKVIEHRRSPLYDELSEEVRLWFFKTQFYRTNAFQGQ